MKTIGIAGLGIMGSAMASRLLAAGHSIVVYNRSPERTAPFAERGARVAASPADLGASCEVVIVMVSDDTALFAITRSPEGVLASMSRGATLINMSTVSPQATTELGKECQARGLDFVDAPVSGSKPQAESGELVILAGGTPEALESARPVLEVIGKKIIHAGPVGKGTALKISVNLILAHYVAALAEGIEFCHSVELDPALLLEVLANAPALNAGYFQFKSKKIFERDFSPQFPLKHMLKDVRLALASVGDNMPVTAAIRERMEDAVSRGLGDKDISVLGQE